MDKGLLMHNEWATLHLSCVLCEKPKILRSEVMPLCVQTAARVDQVTARRNTSIFNHLADTHTHPTLSFMFTLSFIPSHQAENSTIVPIKSQLARGLKIKLLLQEDGSFLGKNCVWTCLSLLCALKCSKKSSKKREWMDKKCWNSEGVECTVQDGLSAWFSPLHLGDSMHLRSCWRNIYLAN